MLAFKTFDAYISAEPNYLPLMAAARVLFLEVNHITQLYLHNHSSCPKEPVFYYEVGLDRYWLIWSRSSEATRRAA